MGALMSYGPWLIAGAILGAGWMIASAIDRLTKLGERMLARFCDFAFTADDRSDSRAIADTSQLRWLVRAAEFQRSGKWDHPSGS